MIKGYNCSSCGGTLARYKDEEIFKCEFCGKLFSDNEECTALEAVRKLITKGRKSNARAMLGDLIASDPGNIVYLWENATLDTGCDKVSDYLKENEDDADKLTALTSSESYLLMKKHMMKDTLVYCKMIEEYAMLRKDIVSTVADNKWLETLEQDRKTYKPSAKEISGEIKNHILGLLIAVAAGVIFAVLWRKEVLYIPAPIYYGGFLILSLIFYVIYLAGRRMEEKSAIEQRNKDITENAARTNDMRSKADELLESIRHIEHDRFISVKG